LGCLRRAERAGTGELCRKHSVDGSSRAIFATACCILASLAFEAAPAADANDGFLGRWKLVLKEPTGDLEGLLELRREQGELIGKDAQGQVLPYECDPDSFFRQLHEDGQLEEYMRRHDRRL
jgi:hypothetical protein